MSYLKTPPKMPAYREKREHGDFLMGLESFFYSKDQFISQFISNLHSHFTVKSAPLSLIREIRKTLSPQHQIYQLDGIGLKKQQFKQIKISLPEV